MSAWRALLGLELRLQLRQPTALALMVGLPLLLGPGALLAGDRWTSATDAATHGDPDAPEVLRIAADPVFAAWVLPEDHLEVVPDGRATDDGTLDDDEVWARVEVTDRTVHVGRHQQLTRARVARERVEAVIARQARQERDRTLDAVGLAPDDATWDIETVAHDVDGTAGGRRLAQLLPPLLLFTLLLGCVYTAFDVVTGDKERRTSETLLSTGVPRTTVLGVKSLVVLGASFLSGTSWVLGVVVAHRLGLLDGTSLEGPLGALTGLNLLWIEGLVLLLGLQVAGAALAVASYVDDYRSGSMVAGPTLLCLLAPSALPALDGLDLQWWIVPLPVGNVAMAFRELLAGQLGVGMGLAVLAMAALHGVVAFRIGLHFLEREATFTGRADADARRAMGRFGADALLGFVAVMLAFWFLGTLAQRVHLVGGHLVSQALFAAAAFGLVGFVGAPRDRLRLRAPRVPDVLLAVLAGLCTPIAAGTLFALMAQLLPGALDLAEAFGASLDGAAQALPLQLLLFALVPGLCEELLFRGALLGLLERDLKPVPRVGLVALLFGLMHLSVYRLLPTTLLGALAGALALRSGSLWVAVAFHATHNAASLAMVRWAGDGAGSGVPGPTEIAAGAAAGLVAVGLVALVGRGARE